MRKILFIQTFLCCALYAKAQLNIIPKTDRVKEYTAENALLYDSIANVDLQNLAALPGQTLFVHGMKRNEQGYVSTFFTENCIYNDNAPVYKGGGYLSTPAKEVEGKYYDVVKVWIESAGSHVLKASMLLREKESGDEIYYKPGQYNRYVTCLGFYEKLKRYIGQTFLSLALPVETEDGRIITPPEGAEFRCVDIGLKMNSDGAFLIMQGADGVKVEAFPIADEVYEFVSTERIAMMEKRYGTKYSKYLSLRKVEVGMTKEMVIAAWGEPYRKTEEKRNGKRFDSWSFPRNRYVDFQDDKVMNVRVYDR